jgi:uncharacterized membrane protein
MRHPLFNLFLGVLLPSVALLASVVPIERAVLLGFDAAAGIFIVATFATLGGAPADKLRAVAARDDAGRILLAATSAVVLLVILVLVGGELRTAGKADAAEIGLTAGTLVLAWTFGNLVCSLHYAHMFYDSRASGEDHAGLAFPGTIEPDFKDFCYFAFVIGMTFQVSDVQILSARIRRAATLHAIAAFLFNIGIVALTVNIVASAI